MPNRKSAKEFPKARDKSKDKSKAGKRGGKNSGEKRRLADLMKKHGVDPASTDIGHLTHPYDLGNHAHISRDDFRRDYGSDPQDK